ncbi:CIA30 family protein [Lyngbya confervoides]|uniref:CIA30 family protein n=1 Tax=Lyngbya confervoides BDU141951 TaxID=1574623 RepID=A0ABD4T5X3_9CYAN|nr:CIA30 family protein [Lyngbya confervoides]MCM1984084.1 CIA30 family protein [Lyngbya confervoides BDU141951]
MSSPRPAWDFRRFWETLAYYESIPFVSDFQKMLFGSTAPPPPVPENNLVFDFSQPNFPLAELWGALDDVVMGGVSQSQIESHPQGARFHGQVSTANSGGFASVRTRNFSPPLNLAEAPGLVLHLQGDGQRYKLILRDSSRWDSLGYAASFATVRGEWMSINIPFSELRPVLRAKTVPNAPPLDSGAIASFQLMLSKFEYDGQLNPSFKPGPFDLLLRSIAIAPGMPHGD